MVVKLTESVTTPPIKKGGKWLARIATPGQGSSGFYSEEMLKRDAHNIIAKEGQAFINHDVSRNPKDMIGVYPEGSYWDEGEKAVMAELSVFSHWKDFVDEVGPHCGMSLFAMGEKDENDNITSITPHAQNGADLVARPGLVGSQLVSPIYESAKMYTESRGVNKEEEENMKPEDVMKALESLTTAVQSLVSARETEAKEEAQVEANEDAVKEALSAYDTQIAAIESAELLPAQVKSLRKLALAGNDVTDAIAEAKTLRDEMKSALAESDNPAGGRVVEGAKYESATALGKVFG